MLGRGAGDNWALGPFPGVLRPPVAAALGLSGRRSKRWYRRLQAGIERNEQPRLWANSPGLDRTGLTLVSSDDRQRVAEMVRCASSLLVVSAHAGPRFVLLDLLTSLRPDLLSVTANPERWTEEERLSVSEGRATADDVLRMQFLKLFAGIRAGGVGLVLPDGGRGSGGGITVDMLGTTAMIGRAVAALARRTGCTCVPMAAAWQQERVVIDVAPPIVAGSSGEADRWERGWVRDYAAWVEAEYRADAMNWRLPTGLTLDFFEPDPAVTEWHHAYNRMVAAIRA